jgi:hypothetical protein
VTFFVQTAASSLSEATINRTPCIAQAKPVEINRMFVFHPRFYKFPVDLKSLRFSIFFQKLAAIPPSAFYSKEHKYLAANMIRFCFIKVNLVNFISFLVLASPELSDCPSGPVERSAPVAGSNPGRTHSSGKSFYTLFSALELSLQIARSYLFPFSHRSQTSLLLIFVISKL